MAEQNRWQSECVLVSRGEIFYVDQQITVDFTRKQLIEHVIIVKSTLALFV